MSGDWDDEIEALYVANADRLWRALFAFAGDREVANDALAEAFAQYLQRRSAVRTPARWIWRAAFHIAKGELKERRMRSSQWAVEETGVNDPTNELLLLLGQLPRTQRAVLILHYYAGYKAREIAKILGSTASTVRVHLSQGRRRLRRMLEEDDG